MIFKVTTVISLASALISNISAKSSNFFATATDEATPRNKILVESNFRSYSTKVLSLNDSQKILQPFVQTRKIRRKRGMITKLLTFLLKAYKTLSKIVKRINKMFKKNLI